MGCSGSKSLKQRQSNDSSKEKDAAPNEHSAAASRAASAGRLDGPAKRSNDAQNTREPTYEGHEPAGDDEKLPENTLSDIAVRMNEEVESQTCDVDLSNPVDDTPREAAITTSVEREDPCWRHNQYGDDDLLSPSDAAAAPAVASSSNEPFQDPATPLASAGALAPPAEPARALAETTEEHQLPQHPPVAVHRSAVSTPRRATRLTPATSHASRTPNGTPALARHQRPQRAAAPTKVRNGATPRQPPSATESAPPQQKPQEPQNIQHGPTSNATSDSNAHVVKQQPVASRSVPVVCPPPSQPTRSARRSAQLLFYQNEGQRRGRRSLVSSGGTGAQHRRSFSRRPRVRQVASMRQTPVSTGRRQGRGGRGSPRAAASPKRVVHEPFGNSRAVSEDVAMVAVVPVTTNATSAAAAASSPEDLSLRETSSEMVLEPAAEESQQTGQALERQWRSPADVAPIAPSSAAAAPVELSGSPSHEPFEAATQEEVTSCGSTSSSAATAMVSSVSFDEEVVPVESDHDGYDPETELSSLQPLSASTDALEREPIRHPAIVPPLSLNEFPQQQQHQNEPAAVPPFRPVVVVHRGSPQSAEQLNGVTSPVDTALPVVQQKLSQVAPSAPLPSWIGVTAAAPAVQCTMLDDLGESQSSSPPAQPSPAAAIAEPAELDGSIPTIATNHDPIELLCNAEDAAAAAPLAATAAARPAFQPQQGGNERNSPAPRAPSASQRRVRAVPMKAPIARHSRPPATEYNSPPVWKASSSPAAVNGSATEAAAVTAAAEREKRAVTSVSTEDAAATTTTASAVVTSPSPPMLPHQVQLIPSTASPPEPQWQLAPSCPAAPRSSMARQIRTVIDLHNVTAI